MKYLKSLRASIVLILAMLSMVSQAQNFSGEGCVVKSKSLSVKSKTLIVLECTGEKQEQLDADNDSALSNAELACPTDPKTCAYYYCRHSWPPVGCL